MGTTKKDYTKHLIDFLREGLKGIETMAGNQPLENVFPQVDIHDLINNKLVHHRCMSIGRDHHKHLFLTTDAGFKYLQQLRSMENL